MRAPRFVREWPSRNRKQSVDIYSIAKREDRAHENQKNDDGAARTVKEDRRRARKDGMEGEGGGEDIEKRSCDQESQLPTLAQVRPVEHIFPT